MVKFQSNQTSDHMTRMEILKISSMHNGLICRKWGFLEFQIIMVVDRWFSRLHGAFCEFWDGLLIGNLHMNLGEVLINKSNRPLVGTQLLTFYTNESSENFRWVVWVKNVVNDDGLVSLANIEISVFPLPHP
jgi:hypothetical protein